MNISRVIVFIMALFMVAGGLDKIAGNRFGLGREFENGFHAMGPLALTMIGITSLSPLLGTFIASATTAFAARTGIDPAMAPALLIPIDTGCYPLAQAITNDAAIADFAALIVASMSGASVTFSVPVALSLIDKKDYPVMALGTMAGFIAMPAGCLIGGLVMGLPVLTALRNLLPVLAFALILAAGLYLFTDRTIRGFVWFGKGIVVLITLVLIAAGYQEITGVTIIPGLAPLTDSFEILGSIAIMLAGAYPMVFIIRKGLKHPLRRISGRLGVNDTAAIGFLTSLANNVPMMEMVREMDEKGKVMNFAFATCAAFTLGDHLGFCSAAAPDRVAAMVCGKLSGGVLAAVIGGLLWSRKTAAEKAGSSVG